MCIRDCHRMFSARHSSAQVVKGKATASSVASRAMNCPCHGPVGGQVQPPPPTMLDQASGQCQKALSPGLQAT